MSTQAIRHFFSFVLFTAVAIAQVPLACTPFTPSECSGAVSLSPVSLAFTATTAGVVNTPAQDVLVSATAGVTSWIVSSDSAWLAVTPASGQPGGTFRVSVVASALPPAGVYSGRITLTAAGATNSPVLLNCALTVTVTGGISPGTSKVVKVSGDGQLTTLFNGFTLPLVVRVEDAAGLPISGKTVTWTEQGGVNFGSAATTLTDANGLAQIAAIPAGYFNPGTPFIAYSITATANVGAATFNMTSYPVTGVGNSNLPPLITLLKPTQENRTITAKLGSTTVDAIRAQVVSGSGNATNPTVIPNVSLNVSTGNTNPAAGIVARCEGGTALSGADGIVSCNLIVEGRTGSTALLVNVGALRDFPGVQLSVTPGDPVTPLILQGNNQTGAPGVTLPSALVVRLVDAYGNPLPGTAVSWTVAPSNAATLLNASGQSDANGNVSAQVRLGSTLGGFQVKVAAGGKEAAFTLAVQGTVPAGNLSLSRTSLLFSGSAAGASVTPPQEVLVGVPSVISTWSAVSNSAWLGVTAASGLGSGKFSVFIVPSAVPAPGTYNGTITVNASGASNGPLVVNCRLTVTSATTRPFGSFDTPANNAAGISGSIAVTGWALDDIGVKSVTIWRDPIGPEPLHPNGYIYIGDALFIVGARPDVEAAHPTLPGANRAGWGYLMLTNALPGKGNGSFKLHAIAVDEEGNQVELGAKAIGVDNLHSIKPFGALDTPAPGQMVSGITSVSGWALTPQPKFIASNGSTIWVNVDGVDRANPLYGTARGDVAAYFPGYANSNAAGGSYLLNTAGFANGMHTIAWIVHDNLGHVDGIGSRYFHIQNGPAAASADSVPAAQETVDAERHFQLRAARLRRFTAPAAYPAFRRGHDADATFTPIRQAGEGLLEPIELKELDRVEIHLPGGQQWTAAMRAGGESRPLPVGSTFDAEGGIFYWQLGPGFLGEYVLEFAAGDGALLLIPVRVGTLTH